MHRRLLFLLLVAGCTSAAPGPSLAPSGSGAARRQVAEVESPATPEQIAYGVMASVALDQVRVMYSAKRIGMYQSDDASAPLYPIVREVLNAHAFKEVHPGETKVACVPARRSGLRGNTA